MLAFPALPLLRSRLAELGAEKIGETFGGDGAVVQLRLPSDRVETLRALLADLTRGRAQLRVLDDS
jgi:putative IMPACT (imprinted ancient) family translation regulator